MRKRYTKQQMRESIAYWQGRLDQLNESGASGKKAVDELLKMAKQISPEQAAMAQKALVQADLNEGTGSGIVMGVMGTLLALSMMGKISLNMKEAVGSLPSGKGQAQVQQCADSIDDITKSLNDINDVVSAIVETNHLDEDPTLEQLLDAVHADVEKADKQAKFEKIMAEP